MSSAKLRRHPWLETRGSQNVGKGSPGQIGLKHHFYRYVNAMCAPALLKQGSGTMLEPLVSNRRNLGHVGEVEAEHH